MTIDSKNITFTEEVEGKIVEYSMIETWDGLYAPVAIRKPEGDGPFPIVLLAAGNGGEGLAWLMDAVRNRAYTMDRLVDAGFACAWLRYRTEVELGYNNGGEMVRVHFCICYSILYFEYLSNTTQHTGTVCATVLRVHWYIFTISESYIET